MLIFLFNLSIITCKSLSVAESPSCIKTFLELQKSREIRTKSPKKDIKKNKLTRRLYVGWKHAINKNVFKIITASKGGGQHVMDLNKDLTLSELTKEITEVFFPNGVSEAQNIRIAEVDFYIAAFSGEKLVHVDGDGNFFSLGTYCVSTTLVLKYTILRLLVFSFIHIT